VLWKVEREEREGKTAVMGEEELLAKSLDVLSPDGI